MPLYHKGVGFPKTMKFPVVTGLIPSEHAKREANSDRYGKFEIPDSFDPIDWQIVEIETNNGALNKIVARKPLDAIRDIVMAFLPRSKIIKTVWVNARNDCHKTLDKTAYAMP